MDIAVNGRFIMSCSEKTDLVLWDLKGDRLATLDTLTMQTHRARVSPCGHFVAASGREVRQGSGRGMRACFNDDATPLRLSFALLCRIHPGREGVGGRVHQVWRV